MKSRFILAALVGITLTAGQTTQASAPLSPQGAQAYLQKINEIQSQYGTSPARNGHETTTPGLAQSRLLDMDGDGDLELQLFYVTKSVKDYGESLQGNMELWTYSDGLSLVHREPIEAQIYPGVEEFHALYNVGDQWYFFKEEAFGVSGRHTESVSLYRMENQQLVEVATAGQGIYEWNWDGVIDYEATYNGQDVSSQLAAGTDQINRFKQEYLSEQFVTIYQVNMSITYSSESCVADLEYLASLPEETAPPAETTPPMEVVPELTAPESSGDGTIVPAGLQHATHVQGAAQQYLEIIQRYTLQYGTSDGSSRGLASAYLLDLEGDGTLELVLTLCLQTDPATIRLEVWDTVGDQVNCTFTHTQGQNFPAKGDWRDVGSLYPYNGGYLLYFAGGGGTDHYRSYDKIYVYHDGTYKLVEQDTLEKIAGRGEGFSFNGTVNQEYYYGSGQTVASAMPEWYRQFKRIQDTYLTGTPVELFYLDKMKGTWPVSSVRNYLEEKVAEATTQPEVVIPGEAETLEAKNAALFQPIIQNAIDSYGYSNGTSRGYGNSFLVDFTGDGLPELLLGYCNKQEFDMRTYSYSDYEDFTAKETVFTFEIWEIQNGSPQRIYQSSQGTSTMRAGGSTTSINSLFQKDGRWHLELASYDYQEYSSENHSRLSYQNGQMVITHSQTRGDSFDGDYWQVSGTDQSKAGYDAAYSEHFPGYKVEIMAANTDEYFYWNTQCALPTLEKILATPPASDHFFGYPVVTDPTIQEKATGLDLGGTLLALYQLEDDLFYAIVSVEGKQESRVLSLGEETPGIVHSATENLSFDQLEEQRTEYATSLSQEVEPDPEFSRPSSREEEGEAAESASLVTYMLGGVAVSLTLGGLGWVIYKKIQKPKS